MTDEPPYIIREEIEFAYRALTGCEPIPEWTIVELETAIREWGMDL